MVVPGQTVAETDARHIGLPADAVGLVDLRDRVLRIVYVATRGLDCGNPVQRPGSDRVPAFTMKASCARTASVDSKTGEMSAAAMTSRRKPKP